MTDTTNTAAASGAATESIALVGTLARLPAHIQKCVIAYGDARAAIAVRAALAAPAQPAAPALSGVTDALEETQSLLAAMLHEARPIEEIDDQMRMNRRTLESFAASRARPDDEDAQLLDWLGESDGRFYNFDKITSIVGDGFWSAGSLTKYGTPREAIRAAIAANQSGVKGVNYE